MPYLCQGSSGRRMCKGWGCLADAWGAVLGGGLFLQLPAITCQLPAALLEKPGWERNSWGNLCAGSWKAVGLRGWHETGCAGRLAGDWGRKRGAAGCCPDLPGDVLAAPLAALTLWFGAVGCHSAALPARLAVDRSWLGCGCRAGFLLRAGSLGLVRTSLQVPWEFLPWLTGRRCLIQPGTWQYELNLQK